MRYRAILLLVFASLAPAAAHADQPEAREVARINNCQPKKVDIYQQSMGAEAKTIYRVECVAPKTVAEAGANATPSPDALLISCDENLCELLRPVVEEKK